MPGFCLLLESSPGREQLCCQPVLKGCSLSAAVGGQSVSLVVRVAPWRTCSTMRPTLAAWCWTAVLLVALFSEPAVCRRGGGRGSSSSSKSRGSSSSSSTRGGFHSLPKSSSSGSSGQSQTGGSSSSSRGAKMVGAAAVGAAVGYGLSSLGRSRYSRGGHSASMAGKPAGQPGFQNPNWSEPMMERGLYSHASKGPRSRVTLLALSPALCGVLYILIRG